MVVPLLSFEMSYSLIWNNLSFRLEVLAVESTIAAQRFRVGAQNLS